MITLIIGLSLSFIAIGVLYYLNSELKKRLENNNIAKLIRKNEDAIYGINKTLPEKIGKIVSQIEFAQNQINKK